MTRWFAGTLDPSGRTQPERLAGALAPSPAAFVDLGPLRLAYTGTVTAQREPFCLLDGCLDNAAELAVALGAPGDAPTEELLAEAWRRWGAGLPQRMRGDFVLVIWDSTRGLGLLARDQLGARGLFLQDYSGALRFASEIRHLLALSAIRPEPDRVTLTHWLSMSNRPGPATLYAGIHRLNPGCMLLLSRNGAREQRYWSPTFSEPRSESPGRVAEEVHAELERSVRRRISPQELTGVMMSGGLDSASVAAILSTSTTGRIQAFSAVFPEHPDVDEAPLIAQLREHLHLPGILAEVRAGGLLGSAIEAIQAWQLPLRSWGDFWALPLLRRAASSGVRVMLGGDGGDEVFGVRAYLLADMLRAGHPLRAAGLVRSLPGAGKRPPTRQAARMLGTLAGAGSLPYELHRLLRRPFATRDPPGWLAPGGHRALVASQDPLAWKRLDGPRWWASAAHGLTRGIEELGLFEHHRHRAASAGLQARHPLLDLELVELALRMPPRMSFDPIRNRPILRAAVAGLLPDPVRQRPGKALFDSVIVDSLSGPDGAAIRALLSEPGAELAAYVDLARVRRELLDSDRLRRERPFDWMCQVWRLTTAECWLRAQADPLAPMLPEGIAPSSPDVVLHTV